MSAAEETSSDHTIWSMRRRLVRPDDLDVAIDDEDQWDERVLTAQAGKRVHVRFEPTAPARAHDRLDAVAVASVDAHVREVGLHHFPLRAERALHHSARA